MPKSPRERQAFSFELKESTDVGAFTGLVSVYGNVDQGNDRVMPGAFTKTLKERGSRVPVLWQHDVHEPIGSGDLVDTPDGLVIKGQIDLDIPQGQRAYSGMRKDYLRGMSFGYDVVKHGYKDGVRELKELKIYEASLVTFPMNEAAGITTVKSFDRSALDLTALRLPAPLEDLVGAILTKSASYADRMQEAYEAVRASFPLAYPCVVDVCDDAIIVSVDGDYYSIAVASWNEANEPTLGSVTPGDYLFVPMVAAVADMTAGDDAKAFRRKAAALLKAGARHSQADQAHIQAAHDSTVSAGAKCAEPKSTDPGTSIKGAAPAAADPDLVQSLRALTEKMRPTAAA